MPTRLTRYVLLEILKIFFVSLIALTMLILLIGVGRELIRRGLGIMAVVQLLPFVLPISLQFAFPATALFSVCCVYGRMAADGEVATVKSSGISPLKLLQPAFIFAALLSPVAVYVSDLAVSWGRPGVNRVVMLSIVDIAYRVLESEHSYTSEQGFSISVREVDGRTLVRPRVTVHNSGNSGPMILTATTGELSLDPESEMLLLKVVDSQFQGGSSFQSLVPGENEFRIPLSDAMSKKDISDQSPSELPLRLISSERIRQDSRSHETVGKMAAHTGFSILASRTEEIAGGEGQSLTHSLSRSKRRLVRLQTEPWRRWAWGFSCFFFVVVGAPLAMIAKTSDYWTTFGLCFLPTLIVYYPLFIFGLEQAKDGTVPPYGVWLGNGILAMIGMGLIARVRRY
ncbi:putative permease YjgP/YjgQ family protein [Rubripirellula lacrimiformis]|uniref:Putative permease YjgP/YjgQ family protein n=1 Tax=Rubripirellula lacrimiformis TaxID=1930273 RepID=A0A517N952_9BACT|nr:LptF/LptG family permease [Rubripirellula lacrimiformis]QDT03666.1 putative permease YjgP/YjgQ family protein [Rubripirellula lacrimiformis]